MSNPADQEELLKAWHALQELRNIVNDQAEDEGIWFITQYASEAYLQLALRRLHEAIEYA